MPDAPRQPIARLQPYGADADAFPHGDAYEPPADLASNPRDFPKMADEAFSGLPGEIVRMIAPHSEADPVALLFTAHTFFGNVVGLGPHYRVEGDRHGVNLFTLLIGDTSKSRKGTSAGRIRQLFGHIDEPWTRGCIHTGQSSGEGENWAVRDPIKKMVQEGKKGDDTNMVEQVVDQGVTDKRLTILESEFAGALRTMERDGNILSRVLRDAWDKGDLASLTKNSPARASGTCISMVGHITTLELRERLAETEMANGFANRILFACVRRSQYLPFGGDLSEDEVATMGVYVAGTVNRARSVGSVSMSEEARALWASVYPTLSQDRPGMLGALTARAEAQTVRLALVYALWDGLNQIEQKHLRAALAVTDYSRQSVEYVFGDTLGEPAADSILSALRQTAPKGLTRTEINNFLSRNYKGNQIARALEHLQHRGLAAMRPDNSTGGRPAQVWFAA